MRQAVSLIKTPVTLPQRASNNMEGGRIEWPGRFTTYFETYQDNIELRLYLSYLAITRDYYASGEGSSQDNAQEIIQATELLVSTLMDKIPNWRRGMAEGDQSRIEMIARDHKDRLSTETSDD